MPIFCVDDGGDGSQTDTTQTSTTLDWSKADVSFAQLIADHPTALAAGNIIYVGDDHNDPNKVANFTLTGPASGASVIIISADKSSATPTYKAGTGNQISALGGNYRLLFDGSFALYGLRLTSGGTGYGAVSFEQDANEYTFAKDCTAVVGAAGTVVLSNGGYGLFENLTVDLSADTTNTGSSIFFGGAGNLVTVVGGSIVAGGYRTGSLFDNDPVIDSISGFDFSSCASAAFQTNNAATRILNAEYCKLSAASLTLTRNTATNNFRMSFVNCGSADAPQNLTFATGFGAVVSSGSIYRASGGSFEGVNAGWLVTTTANCSEHHVLLCPWMYGTISSTGSKAFDVYITNDTADFTNAEVWLEVQFLGTADGAKWSTSNNRRATITTTAAAQTDDTTSTWVGTGPSFTYKQKLSVTATVNEEGQYRARVCVGVASIASSRYFYIDPKVTVT